MYYIKWYTWAVMTEQLTPPYYPFYPWRVDSETGRVFPLVPIASIKKREGNDLSLRAQGVILAAVSIRPDNSGFAYSKLEDSFPHVLEYVDGQHTQSSAVLTRKYRVSTSTILSFLHKLGDDPKYWLPHFKDFISKLRLFPIYRDLSDAEFAPVLRLVIRRKITFDELLQIATTVDPANRATLIFDAAARVSPPVAKDVRRSQEVKGESDVVNRIPKLTPRELEDLGEWDERRIKALRDSLSDSDEFIGKDSVPFYPAQIALFVAAIVDERLAQFDPRLDYVRCRELKLALQQCLVIMQGKSEIKDLRALFLGLRGLVLK